MSEQHYEVLNVLATAAKEIGYQAISTPSKYGEWCAEISGQKWMAGKASYTPYCNMFVSWVFAKAGAGKAIGVQGNNVFAYTVTHLNWFKANSTLVPVSQAQPGDVVFFNWTPRKGDIVKHVGIVEKNLGNGVLQCIEGNTQATNYGNQAHGFGVWRKHRKAFVTHVCRPRWDLTPKTQPKKEDIMLIRKSENGDMFLSDGIHARATYDLGLCQKMQAAGIPTIEISNAQILSNFVVIGKDDLKVPSRVKGVLDILTDYKDAQKPNMLTRILEK